MPVSKATVLALLLTECDKGVDPVISALLWTLMVQNPLIKIHALYGISSEMRGHSDQWGNKHHGHPGLMYHWEFSFSLLPRVCLKFQTLLWRHQGYCSQSTLYEEAKLKFLEAGGILRVYGPSEDQGKAGDHMLRKVIKGRKDHSLIYIIMRSRRERKT